MTDSQTRAKEIAQALGISIPADRLESVARAWEQLVQEVASIRPDVTPKPKPTAYDAAWSDKR